MRRLHLASASERRLAWLKERFANFELSAAALIFEEPRPCLLYTSDAADE